MSQSQLLQITYDLLKPQEKSLLQGVMGFGFAS